MGNICSDNREIKPRAPSVHDGPLTSSIVNDDPTTTTGEGPKLVNEDLEEDEGPWQADPLTEENLAIAQAEPTVQNDAKMAEESLAQQVADPEVVQSEEKVDERESVCPQIPGYDGLAVPEKKDNVPSEIDTDVKVVDEGHESEHTVVLTYKLPKDQRIATPEKEEMSTEQKVVEKGDESEAVIPTDKSESSQIPKDNGIVVPEKEEEKSSAQEEEKEGKLESERPESKLDNDTNLCPLIPGYSGLSVPEASQKQLSEITRDEVDVSLMNKEDKISGDGRSLHWVIRNSHLESSLKFFEQVLGMCVLRHEENKTPCDMTCNGRYRTPWSKTMMGFKDRTEDFAYALEVTYNYGVSEYEKGNGLQELGIFVLNPESSLRAAEDMGFKVDASNKVLGPDDYVYQLLEMPKDRQEPFAYVALQVKDLKRSVDFYIDKLGMCLLSASDLSFKVPEESCILGFELEDKVPLVLTESEDVLVQDHDGRHAIEMPESKIRKIYAGLEKNHKDLIVHSLRELHEQHGTLVITIIKDHDGYEICLVSTKTFRLLVKNGTDYKMPDFEKRKQRS